MTKDNTSWGVNQPSPPRDFSSFLSMLRTSGLDLSTVALGLLTSDKAEFDSYQSALEADEEGFGAAMVVLHPGYASRKTDEAGDGDARGHRHDNHIQHDRRAEMARLRNYLMYAALGAGLSSNVSNILWMDADVYALSDGLLPEMVRSMDDPRVGVLTVISRMGECTDCDYDLNAWRGERSRPSEEERQRLRQEVGSWVAGSPGGTSEHMGDIIQRLGREERERKIASGELDPEDVEGAYDPSQAKFEDPDEKETKHEEVEIEGLFRLDAVGATVVMLQAGLVKQGLSFATSYLVGTDWQSEGWDGVESEGLCVTARGLNSGCWGMRKGFSRHSSG